MIITIKADIPDRWKDEFCSMLKYMESCGNMGHSALIGFYADGDGDFRPKFDIDCEFNQVDHKTDMVLLDKEGVLLDTEVIFDAG